MYIDIFTYICAHEDILKFVRNVLVCVDVCKDVLHVYLYTKFETMYTVVYYINTMYWIHDIRHGTWAYL